MNRLLLWVMLSRCCLCTEIILGKKTHQPWICGIRIQDFPLHVSIWGILRTAHILSSLMSCLPEEGVLNQETQNLVESEWYRQLERFRCGHLRLLQYQKWETSCLERLNPLTLVGPVTELELFFQMSDHCCLVPSQDEYLLSEKQVFFPWLFFPPLLMVSR